jgi:hypothetical protein
MHCIVMSLAHVWLIYPIGHVYVEPEIEVPTEQDFTDLDLNQGKPRCIPPKSLSFIFELYYNTICLCIKFIGVG